MNKIKLIGLLLVCTISAKGQSYLNIGPISAGSSIGRISVSGQTAELSLSNRAVTSFVNNPTQGERWVIYNYGSSTDGKLRFWTNGDKVTFTKEGRVGIGTGSPSKLLDVNGDAKIGNTSQRHYLKISSSISPEVRFQTPSGDETIRLGMAQAASSYYLFDDQDYYVWTAQTNSTPLLVKQNGNVVLNAKMGSVGVGTTSPGTNSKLAVVGGALTVGSSNYTADATLHVQGSYGGFNRMLQINPVGNSKPGLNLLASTDASGNNQWWSWGVDANNTWKIQPGTSFSANAGLNVNNQGKVGIGTSSPDAKLTVKGDIHAEKVTVDLNILAPDYVFEEDYELKSLKETAEYIEENKHLPEVPSAKELASDGVDLVEMNMLLLKKVEELTLHLIEKDQRIEKLELENKRLDNLESRIKNIESYANKK